MNNKLNLIKVLFLGSPRGHFPYWLVSTLAEIIGNK